MENEIKAPVPAYNRFYTEQQYLDLIWEGGVRYEYSDGQIVAMAGGSIRHSKICVNLIASLDRNTRKLGCSTFGPDTMLKILGGNRIFLPDIMISCDETDNEADKFFTSPAVIIEILSDSTELYDRNHKWEQYRKIKSLRHYLLVSQHAYKVEMFSCSNQYELYYYQVFKGIETKVTLANPVMEVSLKDIYAGIEIS